MDKLPSTLKGKPNFACGGYVVFTGLFDHRGNQLMTKLTREKPAQRCGMEVIEGQPVWWCSTVAIDLPDLWDVTNSINPYMPVKKKSTKKAGASSKKKTTAKKKPAKKSTSKPSSAAVRAQNKFAKASTWAKKNRRANETHAQAVKRYYKTQ